MKITIERRDATYSIEMYDCLSFSKLAKAIKPILKSIYGGNPQLINFGNDDYCNRCGKPIEKAEDNDN